MVRTLEQIRNAPTPGDEVEEAYAEGEAAIEANRLIQKFHKEPEFLRRVLVTTANKVLPKKRVAPETMEYDE